MNKTVLLRGGGDLASGVAMRLYRSGIVPLITERAKPLTLRRSVSFAEAVFSGQILIEGITARHALDWEQAKEIMAEGELPVLVDPDLEALNKIQPLALVDARMTKETPEWGTEVAELVIGLGPGFVVGEHCHVVIETMRGHHLGRVLWEGSAQPDTGVPGSMANYDRDRVLRAPTNGKVLAHAEIGDKIKEGDLIATVNGKEVRAAFDGVLRGLIHPSVEVSKGMKIGDLDPRNDPGYVNLVSDKALAIGGGVLEALLSKTEIRARLWA